MNDGREESKSQTATAGRIRIVAAAAALATAATAASGAAGHDARDPTPGTGATTMNLHYKIRAIAGTFVLASLALGWWVSPW